MIRTFSVGLLLTLLLLMSPWVAANEVSDPKPDNVWYHVDEAGNLKLTLYFFWSETCPHCQAAHPFIDSLPERYSWIELKSHAVSEPGALDKWRNIAALTNSQARSVPFIAFCRQAVIGYSSEEVTGAFLLEQLKACYQSLGGQLKSEQGVTSSSSGGEEQPFFMGTCEQGEQGTCEVDAGQGESSQLGANTSAVQPIELPLIGVVQADKMSLPLLTVVLAGVDAFNPCAFFVLLFLLSIMVNAKSRARMLIVGGIFVFFSGFIYFLFMIAWLNVFELLGAGGDGGLIIMAAGLLALIAGAINVKDYFYTKGEVTLSMSAEKRTGLIKRMGQLSSTSSMAVMIFGTTLLAILANAYELLCTAGFPMIYTSVLSMHELPSMERYLYLVFYNVVYVIPLAAIVIAFSMTLGKRKLTEKEGQTLKLMSGIMMVGLGAMLVIDPTALQNVVLAIGLILAAIILTAVILVIRKVLERSRASN